MLLNLPMNPKCGKTWACQLPIMKHFCIVCFSLGRWGVYPSFPDETSRFSVSLSAWLKPPLVYWDLYVKKKKKNSFNQVFCLPSDSTHILALFSVDGNIARMFFFFFLISTRLGMWKWENTARVWEDKINPPFILCKSVYRIFFFVYIIKNHFQLDLCIGCYVIHEQNIG